MVHVIHCLAELEELERTYIQCLVGTMSREQILMFAKAIDALGKTLIQFVSRAAFDGRTINGEMIENLIASALSAASSSPEPTPKSFQFSIRNWMVNE